MRHKGKKERKLIFRLSINSKKLIIYDYDQMEKNEFLLKLSEFFDQFGFNERITIIKIIVMNEIKSKNYNFFDKNIQMRNINDFINKY